MAAGSKGVFREKLRQELNKPVGVGLADTLLLAAFYCYLMGILLPFCAGMAEVATAICKHSPSGRCRLCCSIVGCGFNKIETDVQMP